MFYFLLYPLVFTVSRLLLRVLGRLRSSGEGHVPPSGGLLYCPNHASDADPAAIFVSAPRRCWMVAKRELFEIPVAGWFFAHFHGLSINRDSADRAALRRIEARLKAGDPVLLFPEGRVSETGRLGPMQPGAALLALRAGVPIVPVGLQNMPGLLPYGRLLLQWSPHAVIVTYGPPIRPQDFAHLPRARAITAMTARLGAELARLSAPPQR